MPKIYSSLLPGIDDAVDLGSASNQFKTLHLDGTANVDAISCQGDIGLTGHVTLNTTKKLYLDGGNNTYITESSSDTIKMFTNGSVRLTLTNGAATFAGDIDGGGDIDFSGTATGNGSGLTNLNGSNISSGTINASRVATLNQNTTGSAASLSGLSLGDIVAGGESAYTKVSGNAASSNKFLRSRGAANTATIPSFETISSSDVSGLGSLATASNISNSNWSGTDLSVANGGTGRSSLSSGQVLLGNGTSGINTRAIGISDNNIVEIDGSDIASGEFARFTANGLESRSTSEVLSDIGAQASGNYIGGSGSLSAQDITDIGNLSGTNTGDVCSSDHANAGYLTSSSTASKVTVTDSSSNTAFPVVFHDESNALLDDTGTFEFNPNLETLYVPKDIVHTGDADTYIRFTTDDIKVVMGDTDYVPNWNAAYTAVTTGILASFGSSFVNHDSGLVVATDDVSANFGTYSGSNTVAYDRTTLTYHGDFLKIKNDHGGADKEVMTLDINGRIGLKQVAPLFGVHDSRSSGADADYYLVNGSMGLGTTPRSADGYIDVTGDVFTGVSDKRFKTNIRPYKNPIEKVKSLNGFTYNYNDLAKSIAPNTYGHDNDMAGVFAQEVQKVVPEAVLIAPCDSDEHGKSISGEDYLTVNYEKLVPLLIEAIKEQQEQIEELKTKVYGNTK